MSAPRTFRPGRPDGESPLRMLAQHAVVLLAFVIIVASLAGCARPTAQLRHISASPAVAPAPVRAVEAPTARAAGLAASPVTTTARAGEGLIAITWRMCGSARTWQANAAANGIRPPSYLVRLGQTLRIDCQAAAAPAASGWVKPVSSMGCFRPNGSREFGVWRGNHSHGGIDLGAPSGVYAGNAVRAIHSGVAYHGYQASGAGIYVWVDHRDGTSSWSFHLSSRAVGHGVWVNAGQVIGYVGISGNATAFHLHLETKANGSRVDPVAFLRARGVVISCA